MLAVAGLVVGQVAGWTTVTDRERAWLAFQSERRAFDEWITRRTVPPDATEDRVVTVDSLEGLADVAIDSNRRVIENQSGETFAVLLEETTYRYDPPSPPAEQRLLAILGATDQAAGEAEPVPDDDENEEDTDDEESDIHSFP